MSDVNFEKIPTGRTHQVKGEYQPILDEAGEPETEWALCAIVDGNRIPLETFSVGWVEHMVGRPDTTIDDGSSSQTETTESGGDQTELERMRARVAELEQQAGGNEQTPPTPPSPPAAPAGDQPPA